MRRTGLKESILREVEKRGLRWFGQEMRKDEEDWLRKAMGEPVRGKRSRGRQRKRWKDGVLEAMKERSLKEKDTKERGKWKRGVAASFPTPD